MKKMNNKGFSLVELIIVIAIMAVLVGVLAPQFLRYVEQSRVQKDESSMGEVNNAVKIACANEKIFSAIPDTGTEVTFGGSDGEPVCAVDELQDELAITVGEVKQFSSKKYRGDEAKTTVSIDSDTYSVVVVTEHQGTGWSVK